MEGNTAALLSSVDYIATVSVFILMICTWFVSFCKRDLITKRVFSFKRSSFNEIERKRQLVALEERSLRSFKIKRQLVGPKERSLRSFKIISRDGLFVHCDCTSLDIGCSICDCEIMVMITWFHDSYMIYFYYRIMDGRELLRRAKHRIKEYKQVHSDESFRILVPHTAELKWGENREFSKKSLLKPLCGSTPQINTRPWANTTQDQKCMEEYLKKVKRKGLNVPKGST